MCDFKNETESMTKEQIENYLEYGGLYCPLCSSSNLTTIGGMDEDGCQSVKCLACGKMWIDVYTLTDAEEIR